MDYLENRSEKGGFMYQGLLRVGRKTLTILRFVLLSNQCLIECPGDGIDGANIGPTVYRSVF